MNNNFSTYYKGYEFFIRKFFNKDFYYDKKSDYKGIVYDWERWIKQDFSITPELIFNYFGYHFLYWKWREPKHDITLSMIFGKTAIGRFKKYCNNQLPQYKVLELQSKYGFSKTELLSYCGVSEEQELPQGDFMDIERSRFLNTERGLLNCFDYTTLFSSNSNICKVCNFKNNCKKLKNEFYGRVYL